MGSKAGAIKVAAKKIGLSPDEYLSHINRGEKWCVGHKRWELPYMFGKDSGKADGLDRECKEAKSKRNLLLKLKHRYGLDFETLTDMLEKQDFHCLICGNDISGNSFDIDHDHRTGKVRGILCHPCNSLLGYARDSIERLRSAIVYLEANNE